MALVETQTTMPYPIEEVFALTVDLEKAPHWHSIFRDVQQLTPDPIGLGSRWKINFGVGSFVLEIIDLQRPERVVFKGSRLTMGTVPHFTVELETRLSLLEHGCATWPIHTCRRYGGP